MTDINSNKKDHIPRLSIQLSQEQFDKLAKLIPHGHKNSLFRIIVDDLVSMLSSKNGHKLLGYLLNRDMNLIAGIVNSISSSNIKCSICSGPINPGRSFHGYVLMDSIETAPIYCNPCFIEINRNS